MQEEILQSNPITPTPTPASKPRLLRYVLAFALLILLLGGILVVRFTQGTQPEPNQLSQQATAEISLDELQSLEVARLNITDYNQLLVNGELKINGAFVLPDSEPPTNPQSGQIFFNTENNSVQYYNGTEFVQLALTKDVCLVGATNCGFLRVGDVPEVVLPQDLSTTASPAFANLNLSGQLSVSDGGTGVGSFTANGVLYGNGSNQILDTAAPLAGQILIGNALGVPSFVTLTGDISINSSGVTEIGVNTVGPAELLATAVTAGSYGDGTSYPIFTVDSDGRITSVSSQAIGSGAVVSLNSLAGVLTLAGTANQINIVSGGSTITLSTPQDIATTSNVTFNNVSSNGLLSSTGGLTANGNISLSSTAGNITGIGNSTGALTLTGSSSSAFILNSVNVSAAEFNVLDGGIDESEVVGVVTDVTAGSGLTGGGASGSLTLDIGAGNGITVNANDIAVIYGSAANTAAQGNVTFTCPSGTGNLTGTGNSITIGTGGTCDSLSVVNNPTFSGLVTANGNLTVEAGDTFTFNSDAFTDLTGTGLQISSGSLQTTLGTSVDLASAEVTGILGIGNGGTGAITAQAAINALAGLTTNGDLLYNDGTNSTRIARGSNGACLTSTTTTIQWGSCAGAGSGSTLQAAYDNGNSITTTDNRNISFNLADTATDSDFIVDLLGTGNTFEIRDGGTAFATFSDTGTVLLKNTSNSVSAFQIQNSAGNEVLGIDTTNGEVELGKASTITGKVVLYNASNANTLTIQSGATGGNLTWTLPISNGSNGDCLQTNGSGTLTFSACTGGAGGGVTSIDGQTGVVGVANATGSGGTITIDDASTAAKGIAQFNSTNFSASLGTINTIQDIATTSNVTFNDITSNGNVVLGNATTDRLTVTSQILGGTPLVLQGVTDNLFTTTLAITDPTANNTITLPNASGILAVSASGNIALSAAGNITFTGQLPISNGGTNAASAQVAINNLSGLTTTGDLLYYDGINSSRLARGSTGQCLTANTTTILWQTCSGLVTLQNTYDTGNTIATTDARDLDFTLANTATDANFTIDIATSSTGRFAVQGNGTDVFGVTSSALTVDVAASFNNNVTLGNATGDTITFTGRVNSAINPSANDTYALGSDALRWSDLFVGPATLHVGTSTSDEGAISYNTTSNNLTFNATNGSLFQNSANSTTAFQIQNSAGTSNLFVADTTNTRIGIANISPTTTLDVTGDINLTTGIYYGGTSSPLNIELTRTIPTTVDDYVEIGNFNLGSGAHNFNVSITNSNSGFSVAKQYYIPVQYNGTGNNWRTVLPISETGAYSSQDYQLDINANNNVASLRLRRSAGATAGTARIRIESVGQTNDVFTATSATGSMTAPTTFYGRIYQSISSGRVGIGTNTPSQTLEVNGNISSLGTVIVQNGQGQTPTGASLEVWGNAGQPVLKVGNTGNRAMLAAESIATIYSINGSDAGVVLKVNATGTAVAAQFNNQGSTGNILNLQDGGTTTFSVADGGGVLSKNTVNSTTAFQIQNAAGTSLLNVNTLASGLNLIANPNFESNTYGWSAKGSATISFDNTAGNAIFGGATLKIVGTATTDGAKYTYPFLSSTQYTASFWAKNSSGSLNFIIGRQENGVDVETGCSAGSVTTTWTQFTCTFTTGATINSTSNLYFRQQAAGTPTVYIDGVTLVTGATALTFVNPANNIQVDANYSNITLNSSNNGEIQPWQLNANALPAATSIAATTNANGFIYQIGGSSGGVAVGTVYYAKLNADGSTGAWASTTSLPDARAWAEAVVANGFVYVIGGSNSIASFGYGGAKNTVYYAKLNNNGTIGSWQTNSNVLPYNVYQHSSVIANGYAYLIGGVNSSNTKQSGVYYAKLNADGSTGTWTTTTALVAARYAHRSIVANGYVYTITGSLSGGASALVYYARLNIDGTVGSWTATTSTPSNRLLYGIASLNGYVYVIGGQQGGGGLGTNTIYFAKTNSDGSLSNWATSSMTLPKEIGGVNSTAVNGYIYLPGGWDTGLANQSTVYYTSTSRILVGGSLDLVGLGGQNLNEGGTGGTLTAGNTNIVGSLNAQDNVSFARSLFVGGGLTVNNGAFIGSLGNGVLVDNTNFQIRKSGSARNDIRVNLIPEYTGVVFNGDGVNNTGTLTSDLCSGSSRKSINTGVCAATDEHNYYNWTTAQGSDQDYDLYVRYQLPSDFVAFSSSTSINAFGWRTDGTNNAVDVSVWQANGTQCGSTTNVATGTAVWTETAITGDETACTFAANDIIYFKVHMTASQNEYARAGEIRFNYLSNY